MTWFCIIMFTVHLSPWCIGASWWVCPSRQQSCSSGSPVLCLAWVCARPSRPSACSRGPEGVSGAACAFVCSQTSARAPQSPARVLESDASPRTHKDKICQETSFYPSSVVGNSELLNLKWSESKQTPWLCSWVVIWLSPGRLCEWWQSALDSGIDAVVSVLGETEALWAVSEPRFLPGSSLPPSDKLSILA